ncbi:AMP-binding enzyme [Corynebacterium appendicis CIP 107643]|uniref:AMP-binding enzyme n=1 Tax=Corynebacterium appendicis CIP 107643 TaxID=1161099 RepID=A0A1N7JL86_9CORY|nr:AMP-binding protein [Corynebacterium appendicis]WJY61615.1 Long-chain-fatty-acid--CoA ligase FadD15 [Corynebacterium appendicis CIP 107643]SIS50065.1 AMP-binding enzyme [Corynebacterium appendicis CIP 107643]
MTTYTVPAGFEVAPDENCYSALVATAEKNPDIVLFSRPGEHDWADVTAAEFVAHVRKVAKGLIGIGVEKGDRIALLSGARYEWAVIMQDAINRVNQSVSKAEQIKKFRILPRDLTEEDGELTATLKVKRPVVLDHFAHQMRKLYG